MSLAFYIDECNHKWGDLTQGLYVLPSEDEILLITASYIKKEAFKEKADSIVYIDDIKIENGDELHENAITLCMGSLRYYCDEYTYHNSLLEKYNRMKYEDRENFRKKNKNLTLSKYMSYSRPLNRNPSDVTQLQTEIDTGYDNGYCGRTLNLYGCLIKLLESLPENTLIEQHHANRNGGSIVTGAFYWLFQCYGGIMYEHRLGFPGYDEINQYVSAEEDCLLLAIISKIEKICSKKNIYFDYNPYNCVVIKTESVKEREEHEESGHRVRIIKFKDTYVDGHIDYHDEKRPVGIIESKLISESSYYWKKYDHITEVYDVVYEDGKVGRVTRKYTKYAD